MANLGTLDMASRYAVGSNGLDTFDKYMARQVATNGSDTDKLAYLLGGYLGNYFGRQRNKKDNAKIDKIVEGATQTPTNYDGGVIGATAMTPEQQQSYDKQIAEISNMTSAPTGEATIGAGENIIKQTTTDEALKNMATPVYGEFTQQPAGMNNYNWDYIKNEARKQGVSSKVLESRKADIEKDIAAKARAIYMPQIQEALYGKYVTDENGEQVFQRATPETMVKGLQLAEELRPYDSATADKVAAIGVSGITNANAMADKLSAAKEAAAMNNAYKLGQMDRATANSLRAAKYLGDNGLTKNGAAKQQKTGVSRADYIALGKRHDELGAQLQEKYPDGKLPSTDPMVIQYMTIGDQLGVNPTQQTTSKQPTPQQSGVQATDTPKAKETPKTVKENSKAEEKDHNNNWDEWDINNKQLGAERLEYAADPEAWRKKYNNQFKTVGDYIDWLVKYGE